MVDELTLDVRGGATVGALLGALVEAGASVTRMGRDLGSLGPGDVPIALRVSRAGASVRLHAPRDTPAQRPWGEQRDRLALLAVDDDVASTTLATLERLARARAVVRRQPLAEVEPDPFGGLDETAGAVALASAVSSLGRPRIVTTAVGVGCGTVSTAFGRVDLPGPVVTELLAHRRRVALPVRVELVDPLAAAFIVAATDELADDAGDAALDGLDPATVPMGRGAVHTRDGDVGVVLAVATGCTGTPPGAARPTSRS